MRVQSAVILTILMASPALLSGAAHAADARPAKIHPQMRVLPDAKTECPSRPVDPATERGMRPQPEPPGKAAKLRPLHPGETRGLRPQPEPPGKTGTVRPVMPGAKRGFNPQPEPPAGVGKAGKPLTHGETRGLRPQPEPPGKNLPTGKTASPC